MKFVHRLGLPVQQLLVLLIQKTDSSEQGILCVDCAWKPHCTCQLEFRGIPHGCRNPTATPSEHCLIGVMYACACPVLLVSNSPQVCTVCGFKILGARAAGPRVLDRRTVWACPGLGMLTGEQGLLCQVCPRGSASSRLLGLRTQATLIYQNLLFCRFLLCNF